MRVLVDSERGDVYVLLKGVNSIDASNGTHQYRKFGVTMYWNGHGGLLGIRLEGSSDDEVHVDSLEPSNMVPFRDQELAGARKA